MVVNVQWTGGQPKAESNHFVLFVKITVPTWHIIPISAQDVLNGSIMHFKKCFGKVFFIIDSGLGR